MLSNTRRTLEEHQKDGGAGVLLLLGSSGVLLASGVLLVLDNTEEHQKNARRTPAEENRAQENPGFFGFSPFDLRLPQAGTNQMANLDRLQELLISHFAARSCTSKFIDHS